MTFLLPVDQTLSRRDHRVALLLGEIFDSQGAIQRAPQDHVVLGIREFGLGLLQARTWNAAALRHGA
jgi:hypothetical protein